MILVFYDGGTTLNVYGHANTAPAGKDLVCAGVSALVLTLKLSSDYAYLSPGRAQLRGGDPDVFAAMAKGFEQMAICFPYAVHYKCVKSPGMQ